MSSCSFCKLRDPRWLDELGLCSACAPPLRRFVAATLRAIDHRAELFQLSAVFPTRLSRLEVFVKRLTVLQGVQDRGVAVGIPDLDALLRQAICAKRELVLAELDGLVERTRRKVALASTPRLRFAILGHAAELVQPLANVLAEPAVARPYLAALAREVAAVHAASQRAGSEALALELQKTFAVERFRETLAAVKLSFQPDAEELREIREFEATLAELQDVGRASGRPPARDEPGDGERTSPEARPATA